MKLLVYLLSLLFVTACQEPAPEYKIHSSDVAYKYIQLGNDEPLLHSNDLEVRLMVLSEEGDTLHYVQNYHYFLEPGVSALDTVFRSFHVGDSILLKVNRSLVNDYFKFYKVLQSNAGKVLLAMKIVNEHNFEEARVAKLAFASAREVQEQLQLNNYLSSLSGVDTIDGVYCQVLLATDSSNNRVRYGSEISIHYKGYFMDGYVFDNTYQKSITPTFTFGREYQIIEGFQTALSGRKEGERVKIILPSHHAFGEKGSLAGIVPPYTAVIYDVNIIKVIN